MHKPLSRTYHNHGQQTTDWQRAADYIATKQARLIMKKWFILPVEHSDVRQRYPVNLRSTLRDYVSFCHIRSPGG
jgi:hypothetical protein